MHILNALESTVAEKNTAAAAQAALGPPESHRWPPKGPPIGCGWPPRLSRACQNFKIVIQFTNG